MATSTRLRIGPADQGRRMTLDEFGDAETEDGYRYEMARGVLEVTHVPHERHGMVEWVLIRALGAYDLAHPGLIAFVAGASSMRLWLPGLSSGRNPDISVILEGAPRDRRGRRRPAPVFEVVSPGPEARERDYATKREEYLARGLLEYGIVDPIERRVTVLVRDGDSWAERVFADDRGAAEGLVLPGFAVPLADLWEAHDRGREAGDGDGDGDEVP